MNVYDAYEEGARLRFLDRGAHIVIAKINWLRL